MAQNPTKVEGQTLPTIEGQTRVQAKDRLLVDNVYGSPVDLWQHRFRRIGCGIIFLILLLIILWAVWRFERDTTETYADNVEHFKYGSIGSEPGGSLMDSQGGLLPPYEIFRVLPQITPDRLPGGYASLGLTFEKGHDLPVGITKRYRLGFEQVGVICALCHTGTWRESPTGERHIVAGMPANRLQIQRLFKFLLDSTLDERFTADNVLGLIKRNGVHLSAIDKILYRATLLARVREATLQMQGRMGLLMDPTQVTEWGPGRVDTFNPYKALQFNWPLAQLPREELNAPSDYPSLWNQAPRDGMDLHWDGNNASLAERNLSASLGAGVTPVTIDHPNVDRVATWARTLPAPKYPFPIDAARATRGQTVYNAQCLDCHGDHRFRDGVKSGQWLGKVTPIATIGTDPLRLNSYTFPFASNQYTLYPDSSYRFRHFKKTNGYANQPLDGIWARAPYLHNGSVPTLRDLLEPEANRPATFYKGYDVYDQQKAGFVYNVASEGATQHYLFDTSKPGNGKGGHYYGTTLSPDEKDALVEYMKTF
jgi:hypothetical protein